MKNKIFSTFQTKPKTDRNLQLEFNEILENVISPFFKEMGFRKNGNNFNRKTNELIQAVSVQKSQWNSQDKVSFTFNIGFFDSEIYLEKSKQTIPKFICEYDCQVRFRIGQITKGSDYWYELNKSSKKENLEIEIKVDLNNSLKPILEKNTDLASIKYLLLNDSILTAATPNIYKINFLFKTGEIQKGKELFDKEYFRTLNPEDYIFTTVLPDGTKIVKSSKSEINIKYLNILKDIAKTNKIEL